MLFWLLPLFIPLFVTFSYPPLTTLNRATFYIPAFCWCGISLCLGIVLGVTSSYLCPLI